MDKVALIVWTMAAPVMMGILVLIVLSVPALAAMDAKLIAPAAVAGAVLAVPFSYYVAKKIRALTGGQ